MAMANANITAMKDQLRKMAEEIAKLKDQIPPMEPMLFFVVLLLLALIFISYWLQLFDGGRSYYPQQGWVAA